MQSYLYVVHTRPLLRRAGERLAKQGRRQLAALYLRKADEENGHEQWVLGDLRAIGVNPDIVRHAKPAPGVAAYIAWNSFTVDHGSPVAFLGTAYVLESGGASRAGTIAKNVVAHSGIRGIERGVFFLEGHADADIDHVAQLGQLIDAYASSDTDCRDLVLSAWVARSTYIGLLTAVAAEAAERHDAIATTCAA
ncbi:MAG: iron-containing redox enzyme family protein [Polyangiaceae bacterium]|nr:iron-containing redox enzyme family protein [Polyangiaceae bacterium]